jgi:gas vesicle structural protein
MSIGATPRGYIERPRPSGLADVIDVILDKGLVVDAYVRVSLIGIEILTIDARIVIASVDTYLRFAEAVNRLDISESDQAEGLPQLIEKMTSGGAESKTKGALEGVKNELTGGGNGGDGDDDQGMLQRLISKIEGEDDDGDDGDEKEQRPRRRSRSAAASSGSRSRSTGGSSSRSRSSSSSSSRSRKSSSSGSGSRSRKASK